MAANARNDHTSDKDRTTATIRLPHAQLGKPALDPDGADLAAVNRRCRHVAAIHFYAARVRREVPGQLADQRGLAGAVRPDDGVQFALRDIERDVIGRDDAAETTHEIFDAEQRISHGKTSRECP